jgi:hypothetical protein
MIEVEGVASDPRQKFLGKEFALLDRYELQDALVETLKDTKYCYRIESVANCHRMFRGRTCRNGHNWAKAAKSCGLRLCPHCCRQRATEVAQKLQPFLASKAENSLRFMVLTDRNCADLDEGRNLIYAAFSRLRRSVAWKKKVKGCIVTFEATSNPHCECGQRQREHQSEVNEGDKQRPGRARDCAFVKAVQQTDPWHPHLNVLAEGEYFPQAQLSQMWETATEGRANVVWVSAVKNGFIDLEEGGTSKAARELVKYITKMSDLVGDPAAVEQFLDAVYNRRLLRTYGTFYALKLPEELEAHAELCPDCGTNEWVMTSFIGPQQISMDFKGVLRDNRKKRDVDRDVAGAVSFVPGASREKALVDGAAYSRMKKSWTDRGLTFEERGEEWKAAADRVAAAKVNVIAGWGYSEWLAGGTGGAA